MLPLNRRYKIQIPNHLAVFAALLLVLTSFTGLGSSDMAGGKYSNSQAAGEVNGGTPAQVHSAAPVSTKKNKGFKMSLFLFRN